MNDGNRRTSWLPFVFASLFAACGRTALEVPVQDAGPTAAPSNRGTDFWAVSTSNPLRPREYGFSFAVAIGNPNDDPVRLTITGGALSSPLHSTIAPHQSTTATLPWVERLFSPPTTPAC